MNRAIVSKKTQLSRNFGRVRVLERDGYMEIQWPTLGNVYIEEAEQFLRDLQQAVKYAKKFYVTNEYN